MPSDFKFDKPVDKKPDPQKAPKTRKHREIFVGLSKWWRGLGKNTRFGIASVILLVFAAIAIGIFYLNQPESDPSIQISKKEPPAPTTLASPLTGVQVAPELSKRPVTAIMIENSQDARPQSALHEAGVVFEAIAEGGITRFLVLFQESQPQYIGPVRSLRPYFIDFASAFQAPIAHVGGSPDALAQIRSGGRDLDQFFNSGSYWRSSARRAPHNVYTSFERLDALNQKKGYTSSQFTPWPRKEDAKLATPTARGINVNVSSAPYNSRYDYDPATNSYGRSQAGGAHISTSAEADGTGQQIKPKAVIVLITSYGTSGKYSVYGVTGGNLLVFQDGGVTAGSWSKAGRDSQFVFLDSAGAPLKINTGQSWITLVSGPEKVTYAP